MEEEILELASKIVDNILRYPRMFIFKHISMAPLRKIQSSRTADMPVAEFEPVVTQILESSQSSIVNVMDFNKTMLQGMNCDHSRLPMPDVS